MLLWNAMVCGYEVATTAKCGCINMCGSQDRSGELEIVVLEF